MPKVERQKVKGCRKCGRSSKRAESIGNPISLFVRDKITAEQYFKLTNQKVKTS